MSRGMPLAHWYHLTLSVSAGCLFPYGIVEFKSSRLRQCLLAMAYNFVNLLLDGQYDLKEIQVPYETQGVRPVQGVSQEMTFG